MVIQHKLIRLFLTIKDGFVHEAMFLRQETKNQTRKSRALQDQEIKQKPLAHFTGSKSSSALVSLVL